MSFPSETVTISSLAYGGDAVGHIDKKVIFVPDAVPGDVVRVRVKEDKSSFLRGEIDTIISSSPHRTEPFCPLSLDCGGCQALRSNPACLHRWTEATGLLQDIQLKLQEKELCLVIMGDGHITSPQSMNAL